MKSIKKILGMAMVSLFAFVPFLNVSALTEYNYEAWQAPETYGTVTKIDDNITNIKGGTNTSGFGPYSKVSTARLEDGITEEIYIELDPEKFEQAEHFTLGISLGADEAFESTGNDYVTETNIFTQMDNGVIYVSPTFDSETRIPVTEKGVYTYQYNYYIKDGSVYTNFKLLLWDKVIGESKEANMDEVPLVTNETINPVVENATKVRTVLFNNMAIANGVNVYTTLPEKPSEEIPVEPVEPTEPSEEVTTPDSTIEEQNPETSDSIVLTIGMLVTSLTLVGFGVRAIKKRA